MPFEAGAHVRLKHEVDTIDAGMPGIVGEMNRQTGTVTVQFGSGVHDVHEEALERVPDDQRHWSSRKWRRNVANTAM